jgi:hypothetical protein
MEAMDKSGWTIIQDTPDDADDRIYDAIKLVVSRNGGLAEPDRSMGTVQVKKTEYLYQVGSTTGAQLEFDIRVLIHPSGSQLPIVLLGSLGAILPRFEVTLRTLKKMAEEVQANTSIPEIDVGIEAEETEEVQEERDDYRPVIALIPQLDRVQSFEPADRFFLAMRSLEIMLLEIDRVIQQERLSSEQTARLEADRSVLHAMLRHPDPPVRIVEAAVVDAWKVLGPKSHDPTEIRASLVEGGFDLESATELETGLRRILELGSSLDSDSGSDDITAVVTEIARVGEQFEDSLASTGQTSKSRSAIEKGALRGLEDLAYRVVSSYLPRAAAIAVMSSIELVSGRPMTTLMSIILAAARKALGL